MLQNDAGRRILLHPPLEDLVVDPGRAVDGTFGNVLPCLEGRDT